MSNKIYSPDGNELVETQVISLEENLRLIDVAIIDAIETVRARVPEPIKSIRDLRRCQDKYPE